MGGAEAGRPYLTPHRICAQMRKVMERLNLIFAAIVSFFFLAPANVLLAQQVSESPSQSNEYDVVIRNGRVLDGAGNPWISADIAILNGRIARIGSIKGSGNTEIDAANRYVSPGWIDMMDQSGEVLLKNGLAENKLKMGVTTAIGGEGGAPVPASELPNYFAVLREKGISMNFGTYYGATQARVEVINDVARKPTVKERQKMEAIVRQAMQNGAFGLTTALIYPPATFQSTEELVALAKAMRPYGGIYASHIRDEGSQLVSAINEAATIGEKAGVPVEIFHLKAAYQPGWGQIMPLAGQAIEDARKRGVDIAADMYPYTAGGTGFDVLIPPEVLENGVDEAIKDLRDPEFRTRLLRRVKADEFGSWSQLNLVQASGGWDNIVLANANSAKYNPYNNRRMSDIARELDQDPWDLAWNIVLEAYPNRAGGYFFFISEKDIETALRFPWIGIGSDAAAAEVEGGVDALGLPHPRSYGTFPRVIARYVRERSVLSLEDAIRKMTSWPAQRLGIRDRGVLREGLWADVVVFDFDNIKDNANWIDGTASPTGIDYVLVNGEIVVDYGRHTGLRPGRVLLGQGAQSSDEVED